MTTGEQPTRDAWERLTLTELAAARFLCAGHDEDAIAAQLDLPAATVSAIIARLYDKLGVASRVDLVIRAVRRPGRL